MLNGVDMSLWFTVDGASTVAHETKINTSPNHLQKALAESAYHSWGFSRVQLYLHAKRTEFADARGRDLSI